DEAGAVGIGPRGRGIVDHDPPALAVDPVREIAVVHFGRRNAQRRRIRRLAVLEAFERDEEERPVLAVIRARNPYGTAPGRAVIVLPVDAFLRLEESLPVQGVVAEKVVDGPMEL